MRKELAGLIASLVAQGFTVEETRTNHFIVRTSAGVYVTGLAPTPSDRRGDLNVLARLRRHGYRDPKRQGGSKKGKARKKG